MKCPKNWKKLGKILKNQRRIQGFVSSVPSGSGDAESILKSWYSSLVGAERSALSAVGLGDLSKFMSWVRARSIEDPIFILDLAQAVVTNQPVIPILVQQVMNPTPGRTTPSEILIQ